MVLRGVTTGTGLLDQYESQNRHMRNASEKYVEDQSGVCSIALEFRGPRQHAARWQRGKACVRDRSLHVHVDETSIAATCVIENHKIGLAVARSRKRLDAMSIVAAAPPQRRVPQGLCHDCDGTPASYLGGCQRRDMSSG